MKRTYIAAALLACTAASPLMAAETIYYYPAAPVNYYPPSPAMVPGTVYVVKADTNLLAVQQRLYDIGYKDVRVNGIWESRTIAALRLFQEDQKLPITGNLDQRTLSRLNMAEPEPVRISSVSTVPVIVSGETPVVVYPRVEYVPAQF